MQEEKKWKKNAGKMFSRHLIRVTLHQGELVFEMPPKDQTKSLQSVLISRREHVNMLAPEHCNTPYICREQFTPLCKQSLMPKSCIQGNLKTIKKSEKITLDLSREK